MDPCQELVRAQGLVKGGEGSLCTFSGRIKYLVVSAM